MNIFSLMFRWLLWKSKSNILTSYDHNILHLPSLKITNFEVEVYLQLYSRPKVTMHSYYEDKHQNKNRRLPKKPELKAKDILNETEDTH